MRQKWIGIAMAAVMTAGVFTMGACKSGEEPSSAAVPEIICTAQEEAYTITSGREFTGFPLILCKLNGKTMSPKDYTVVDELDPNAEMDTLAGTYRSDVPGRHVIRITAVNPEDPSKVATTSFTINVYRRIFTLASTAGNMFAEQWVGDPYAPVESQYVMMTDKTNSLGILAVEPGTLYYAEAEFQGLIKYTNSNDFYGFAHVSDYTGVDGLGQNGTRWLGSALASGTALSRYLNGFGEKMAVTFTDVNNWWQYDLGSSKTFVARHYDVYKDGGYPGAKSVDTTFKYAVARSGDTFYAFVNDVLVGAVTDDYYSTVNTAPAFWARMHDNAAAEGNDWKGKTIRNIDFCEGEQAQSRIDALVNGGIVNWGANFAKDAIGNGTITVGERTAEKGLNFTCTKEDTWTNDAAVTLDRALGGDFTLSFTYKPESVGTADGVTRGDFFVDLRNASWKSTILQTGGWFSSLNEGALSFNEGEAWNTADAHVFGADFDAGKGVSVTIRRDLQTENEKSVYTVTYVSVANPEQTVSYVYEDTSADWNTKAYPVFKNRRMKGTWSNIVLSTDGIV